MEETKLVELARQGDEASFNQLVEKYHRLAYNLAYRFLGQAASADDVTQEAFISVWQGLKGFRGGNFKSWLLQIVANACRDYLRSHKRHPTVSYDAMPVPPDPPSADLESSVELGESIQKGLARLPEEQRLAIILSDVIGLSYEEMAEAMKCNIGTVRSRLSRGRASLRDWLVSQAVF
ncbi:MAG: sigma-70 family RNA polymerase sigma factor [Chloroflexi bacterium]|nr:sigma-70 family RNA polymerase sigma factor [Chloroflexota bacterium]